MEPWKPPQTTPPLQNWWNPAGTLVEPLVEPCFNLISGSARTTPEPIWAETPSFQLLGKKQRALIRPVAYDPAAAMSRTWVFWEFSCGWRFREGTMRQHTFSRPNFEGIDVQQQMTSAMHIRNARLFFLLVMVPPGNGVFRASSRRIVHSRSCPG